jgi:squalene-associated FAD-dependent desaturase
MAASEPKTVGVIGGGLAGLAAGCALADAGLKVTVFERRPYVGGRASSYEHPGTGEVVDNCQHVLLGCCTNLIHFYETLGVSDKIRWFDELTFLEPGGRASSFRPTKFLPAPMHNVPAFLGAHMLSAKDKLAIARAMFAMSRGLPDTTEDFLSWLRRHGQTETGIDRFWKTVLVSALNEDLERVSSRYAAQVFRESFMNSAAAGRMGVPSIPLSQLYSAAIDYIQTRGGEVLLRCPASALATCSEGVKITTSAGERRFDYAVVAAPFQAVGGLLPTDGVGAQLKERLGHFEPSPITGIHLWFDREITPLPHAVLLDRTIQWMFQKSKFQHEREGPGSYIEVVVSASKSLVQKSREQVLEIALRELAEFFPLVENANVLKAAVIKEVHATYSVLPGLDKFRPAARTAWPGIFLAGDWTSSGWPATMEGAVRSGYLAAEAVIGRKFLVADLKPKGFMRLF